MDHPAQVRISKRVRDLRQQSPYLIERLPRLTGQEGCQIAASHERHHEVREPLQFSDVVDRNDVRVRQLRRHLRLARKARADRWIVGQLRRKDLDGHGSVEPPIARPIYHGHSAAPNLPIDFILRPDRGDDSLLQGFAHDGHDNGSRCLLVAGMDCALPLQVPSFHHGWLS